MSMRTVLLIVVMTLAAAPLSGAIVSGVAAARNDVRCVAFVGGHVAAAGDVVTLVAPAAPGVPAWSAVVTVQRPVAECAPLDEVMAGPYYEVSAPDKDDDGSWIAIAVPGAPPLRKTARSFTAQLDGECPREWFAMCASYEGLHLTIWSGHPGRGKRRSHIYAYLGYDVEPTCSDAEAADPEGAEAAQ